MSRTTMRRPGALLAAAYAAGVAAAMAPGSDIPAVVVDDASLTVSGISSGAMMRCAWPAPAPNLAYAAPPRRCCVRRALRRLSAAAARSLPQLLCLASHASRPRCAATGPAPPQPIPLALVTPHPVLPHPCSHQMHVIFSLT